MRCPDCQKFVSYDTEVDPEENSLEVSEVEDDTVTLTASFQRTLTCGECGTELKSAELEFSDVTVELLAPDPKEKHDVDYVVCNHEDVSLEASASPTTDVQTTDRHGKPIKNARYMTTLYGVEVEFSATCSQCGGHGITTASEALAASSFDEQV